MEESKALSKEGLKNVSGGELQHMAMMCPNCGEWNDNGWYEPPKLGDNVETLRVTFHCKNCNCEYTGGFLVKA